MRTLNKIFHGLGLLLCVALLSACSKPVAKVPAGWVTFQPSDSAFTCDAPLNWQNTPFTDLGTDSGGDFISGPAHIKVISSLVGSIAGDMANANNSQAQNLADQLGAPAPNLKSPAQQTHEQFEQPMQQDHPDYSETNEQQIVGKSGQGWMSEFSYSGGSVHGYRATFLGKDRSIEIICSCPQSDWAQLQSSFLHVIQSVAPGTGAS